MVGTKKKNAKNVFFKIQTGDGNPKTDGSLAAGPAAFQPTIIVWLEMCRMDGDARIQYNPAISAVCSSLC
jgi:hypothetical protein